MNNSFPLFTDHNYSYFTKQSKWCIITHMAKRITGLDKKKTSRSKKTKKRLEIKREMLAKKAGKKGR